MPFNPNYSKTMRAAVLNKERRIEIDDIAIPEIGTNDVLVKVATTGICGSDVSTFIGQHPYKKAPTVLGHEFSGTVVAIGENVTDFKVGDRVCAAAYSNCGECEPCSVGHHNLCENKTAFSFQGWDGSFAQYIRAEPQKLYLLGPNVDDDCGALVEPLAIALHALRLAPKTVGELTVIGSGCIGLSAALCAKLVGFNWVRATDIHNDKKALANCCEVDEFTTDIHSLTPGDVTLVCASYDTVLKDALQCTRPGGTIVVVSYFSKPLTADFNELVKNEINMLGSALAEDRDFIDIIEWIDKGELDPSVMVTHRFPISKAHEALELKIAEPASTNKILLNLDS